jgi:hypothetical protein
VRLLARAQVAAADAGATLVAGGAHLALHVLQVREAAVLEGPGGRLQRAQQRLRRRLARLVGDLVEPVGDRRPGVVHQPVDQVAQRQDLVLVEAAARLRLADLLAHRSRTRPQVGEVGQLREARGQFARARPPPLHLVVARLGHGPLPRGLRVVGRLEARHRLDPVERTVPVVEDLAQPVACRREPRRPRALAPGRLQPPPHRHQLRPVLVMAGDALPLPLRGLLAARHGGGVELAHRAHVLDGRQSVLQDVEPDRQGVPQVGDVDLRRERLDLPADGLELAAQGQPQRLRLRPPGGLEVGQAVADRAPGGVFAPQRSDLVAEGGDVAQQLLVPGDERLEVVGLALDLERPEPVLGLGRGGRRRRGVDLGGTDRLRRPRRRRRRPRSPVAAPQVGQGAVLEDRRLDQLAELAGELLGALDLRLDQRSPGLGLAHRADQGIETANRGRPERRHRLEGGLEVRQHPRLQDQVVLELLLDEVQLGLGLRQELGGVASGPRLVLGQLRQRAELPDLGPGEVDVERAQGCLQALQRLLRRRVPPRRRVGALGRVRAPRRPAGAGGGDRRGTVSLR